MLDLRLPRPAAGFSLLELLAVVLIIGLAAALVSFSGSSSQSDYQLKAQLRHFANAVSLLAEEASLAGEQRGVDLYRELLDGEEIYAYRWLRRVEGQWEVYTPADFTEENLFPSGYGLLLEVDESEVVITAKLIPAETNSLDSEELLPDIWLFSSGEITPFVLSLVSREQPENEQLLRVDMLGRMTLDDEETE